MKKRYIIPVCLALILTAACAKRGSDASDNLSDAGPEQSVSSQAGKAPDASFETVTSHVGLKAPGVLLISRPEKDFSTDADSYYLTGASDPDMPLLLNGEEVRNRGPAGSFAVFSDLEMGENAFVFSQEDKRETVTITRVAEVEPVRTKMLFRMYPETNFVMRAGEEYTLSCTAPAGSKVTASIKGREVELAQRAVTFVDGIPASYGASFIPDDLEGIEEVGPITYTLEWEGTTREFTSDGSLYLMGKDHELQVRIANTTATVFTEDSDDSAPLTALARGAADRVEEISSGMYRLGMGGWIGMGAVEPLTVNEEIAQKATGSRLEARDGSEALVVEGISGRPCDAERKGNALVITLYHATGLGEIGVADSRLFSSSKVREEDGNSIVTMMIEEADRFQGWQVSYEGKNTVIAFTLKPETAEGNLPLSGFRVLLDPGHGGSDPGTLCIFGDENSPAEEDISLATALAVRTCLEAKGATVTMTRSSDEYLGLNERLEMIQQPDIDLAVSLHCNSMPYTNDGTGVSGVETYYFTGISRPLAREIQEAVCSATGRTDRGIHIANYRVVLSSNVPSVLVEMGFMTNPAEFDAMCGKQGIYDMAAAVAAGIEKTYAKEAEESGGDE